MALSDPLYTRTIATQLKPIISAIQYGAEPAFVSVVAGLDDQLDGYPAVRILPAEVGNEIATSSSNDRKPSFLIRTHIPGTSENEIFYMYDLTDLIIDAIDAADKADTIDLSALNVQQFLVRADRGEWYVADTEAGPVLMCDIRVTVSYSKVI